MTPFRIFFGTGDSYARHGLILVCLLAAGLAEGFGLATILPVLTVSTGETLGARPEFAQNMIEFLSARGVPVSFEALLAIMLAGLILKEVLTFLAMTFVGYTIADVATEYRWRLIDAFLAARWAYFTREPLGQLTHAVSSFANGAADAFLQSARLISILFRMIVYLTVIILISGKLAIVALAAGLLIAALLHWLVGVARKAGRKQQLTDQLLSVNLTDIFASIKPLKAMSRQEHVHLLFHGTVKRLRKMIRKTVLSGQALVSLQSLLETLLLGAGLYVAVAYWNMSLLELGVIGGLMLHIMKSVGKLQRQFQTVAIREISFMRIREIIKAAEEAREHNPGTAAPQLEKAITLEDVSFAYGTKAVIRSVTATFPAEKLTVIHGPSGQGKTTLTDLILGLYRPDSGRVLVDCVPLDEIDIQQWRARVGYVPQELILHNGTIKMNITLGDPALTDEDVWEALRLADAVDFVTELDHGIRTEIGEKGLKLSGGQRQRISLARALVHKPKLIVLDEVTSALDPKTERAICHHIHGLTDGRTIIAITHRPAWLEAADVVYEMADQKVVKKQLEKIAV